MYVYVLGSGGGRYMLATQRLRTSGLWVSYNDINMFIDPGNGALRDALSLSLPFSHLNYLLISHQHLDHYDDAEAVIEATYFYKKNKKDLILITNSCMNGVPSHRCSKLISEYHNSLVNEWVIGEPHHEYRDNRVHITFTPTLHHEPHGIGFVIDFGDLRLGYPSDTGYFLDFKRYYSDVDILILHFAVMVKESGTSYRHADKEDIMRMIDETNAKYIILKHFGPKVLEYGLDKLEKEFNNMFEDKKVIFARDLFEYYIE